MTDSYINYNKNIHHGHRLISQKLLGKHLMRFPFARLPSYLISSSNHKTKAHQTSETYYLLPFFFSIYNLISFVSATHFPTNFRNKVSTRNKSSRVFCSLIKMGQNSVGVIRDCCQCGTNAKYFVPLSSVVIFLNLNYIM